MPTAVHLHDDLSYHHTYCNTTHQCYTDMYLYALRQMLGEQLEVVRERARVRREVFVGRELRGVHKDRQHRQIVLGQRPSDCGMGLGWGSGAEADALTEGQMAFMQRTHRRHKPHRLLLIVRFPPPFPIRLHGRKDRYGRFG